ncbi:NUDIX hydrolase [Streptomyces sp. AV19]|uniref:DUF6415 family natural product biosynthesis protein n=1 Tax=Streptomyces sp. AV19 TaxID=2793068 RepID=UPI0018FE892B|nr:DUF6415 family natural product biosynthesis protein [Streptomyces sp. AV19]MBH1933918.1 NUDIX hydrolase [Streptomyces sp. AV19]MDG4535598.1 NUDIX hydrolase [Streptomyces sp. AV19]
MPVWPGTAMSNGGGRAAPALDPEAEAEIERVIGLVLAATAPPPAETLESATAKLRRFIGDWASWVKVTARQSLPVDDPRRVAAERAADEATYRARCADPGDGLESAFTYCRSLALIVRELMGHRRGFARPTEPPAARLRVSGRALIQRPSPTDAAPEVLMVSPSYPGMPGTNFRLPGGPATADEPAWEAMTRTVLEETGLAVRPARLLVTDWAQGDGNGGGITFVYAVAPCGDDMTVTLPGCPELAGFTWVPVGELGERCAPPQALRVRAALDAAHSGTLAELRRGEPAYAVAA